MPAGDVYMGTVWTRYQENDNAHIWCVEVTGESIQSQTPADINTWLSGTVVPGLKDLQNTGVVYRCVSTQQVWSNGDTPAPATSIPNVALLNDEPGERTCITGQAPGQLSAVAQIITNQDNPTARNRGRDFWWGMCIGDMSTTLGEQWDASFLMEIMTFYQTLTSSFTGTGGNTFRWGVFSRVQAAENSFPTLVGDDGVANEDRPTFGQPFFNVATLIRMNPMIRTQRRRQPLDPCKIYPNLPVPA